MKKIFFAVFLLWGFIASAQDGPPNSTYTKISTTGYNWLRGYFRALHLPAGDSAVLQPGQWTGSGGVYLDTLDTEASPAGLYIYQSGVWTLFTGSGSGGFFGDETNDGGATTKDGNGEDYTITGVDTFSLSGNSIYLSPVDSLMLENISVDGEGETPEEITNLLGITGTGKVKAAPDYFGRFGTEGDPIATANRAFNLQENQLIIAGSEDDNGSSFKINPYEVNLHSSYLTGGVRLLFQDGETGSLHGETGAGNSGFFVDITDTDNPEVEVKSHGNINLEATLSGKQISLNTPTYLLQFPDITDNSGHIYVNKQFQRGTSSQVVYYDSTAQEFLWGPAPSGGGGGFFTSSSSTGNTTQDGEGDVFRLIDVSEFGIRATSSGSLDRFRVDATSTVMVSNEGNAFISASDQQIDLDATNVVVPILAGVGDRAVGADATGKLKIIAGGGFDSTFMSARIDSAFNEIIAIDDSTIGMVRPNGLIDSIVIRGVIPPDPTVSYVIAASDETTDITTGDAKVTFRIPHAMTITEVRASLTTASSSGNPAIRIKESGVTILSTNITIDSGEKTSESAAAPPVISDVSLSDDAEITIDVVTSGTGAKGLKVIITGTK